MDILTTAAQGYMNTFSGYINQFLQWGQWIFYSLLTLNIVWIALWYAFDRDSISDSMGKFIKRFFVISFFYTVMMNHSWLVSLLQTSQTMGSILTGAQTDPSSIISQGIGIANKVIAPVQSMSLLTIGFGAIIILIVYIIILFAFISIALQLALTLIITTGLITFSTFFLGFAALSSTSQIARNILDVILANCMKLVGIYFVVAAGSKSITNVTNTIPTTVGSFDEYVWLLTVVLLFWMLARNLPEQIAKIVTFVAQESHGHDAAALAIAANQYSSMALSGASAISASVTGVSAATAKLLGSTAYNASSNLKHQFSNKNASPIGLATAITSAAVGTASDLGKSVSSTVSDHFRHLTDKMTGGAGIKEDGTPIQGIASRLYGISKNKNFLTDSNGKPTSKPSTSNI